MTDPGKHELPEPATSEPNSADYGDVPRTSPYALASLIVALVALWTVGSGVLGVTPQPYRMQIIASELVHAVVPIGGALIAFWLAARGEDEVLSSNGRLIGQGFCVAARAAAVLTLIVVIVSVIVLLFLPEPETLRLGL